MATVIGDDGCTKTFLECVVEKNIAKTVFKQSNECPEPATKQQVDEVARNLTRLLETYFNKTGRSLN